MKILVTGGAGMIGSNLVNSLISLHHDVYVVDNLWRGKISNLKSINKFNIKKNFFKFDLTNYNNCQKVTKKIDIVFHLADIVTGVDFVFKNEPLVFNKNVIMNSNILNASIQNKVKKFIYVGTACSYPMSLQSQINEKPLKEEQAYPANPESSYGWSKLMGEYECLLAQKFKLINIGILRLHNVYGTPTDINPKSSQVIPALCRKAITQNVINVWGSGKQRRAFLHVDDVVDALIDISKKGINKGVIQIGPEKSTSIKEIAKKIKKISARDIKIKFNKSKIEGDKDRSANIQKAKKILKWRQKISLDVGLKQVYDWTQKQIGKKK